MKKGQSTDEPKAKRGKKASLVDTISESVKLLRRFRNMLNKTIPTQRLYSFIKSLQKAIHERRIRKGDSYSSQIEVAQRLAVQTYQKSFGKSTEVKAPKAFVDELSEIGKSEKVRPSVAFLKRFVALVGQPWHTAMKKIRQLTETLKFLKERNMITESDPYYDKVKQAERVLTLAISKRQRITVPAATLQGLNGIIEEETVPIERTLGSIETENHKVQEKPARVTTAKQAAEKVYDALPFDGYFQKLLGEPGRNFWMVIYGLPYQGKTTFSMGFAKYLAENMGNVYYASAENYDSAGLKEIIKLVGANDLTQLHTAPSIDEVDSLKPYDFIFIDSATAAEMSVEEVKTLREEYPDKAFITILQSTKAGDFRGNQRWRHDPGIVIRIEDRKASVEKNQYRSSGEIVLALPKLIGVAKPQTVDESLDGHKKGNRETLVVGCGYMASIPGIHRMINETPESVQRMLKSTPEKIAAKLVKVLERRCEKLGARVRIEDFMLTDTDTKDNVNGTVFFHCNVRGRLGELKKVIDDWGGHIFVAMQDVPWE